MGGAKGTTGGTDSPFAAPLRYTGVSAHYSHSIQSGCKVAWNTKSPPAGKRYRGTGVC